MEAPMVRTPKFALLAFIASSVVVLGACGGRATTKNAEAVAHGSARDGVGPAAREVCEPMVRESVPAVVGVPVVGEPVSSVRGDTFSCRYGFDGGALDLSVRDMHTLGQAREYFGEVERSEAVREVLPGLAEGGFSRSDGSVVAKKDAMILTVDVTDLPPTGVERANVGIEVAAAVLGCW
jgi:hypothetical protein